MILQQLKQQSTMRRSFEACFAPGTPQSAVDAFYAQNVHLLQAQPFRPANRWTTTATDGGGIAQGTPITLTWGVVADGTPLDNGSPSNLRAFLNGIYGSQAVWLSLMQQVFDRWSELTGITYVFESNDDGASFPNSRGVVGTRPDMRIGGRTIDGPSNTLAFNYYPNTGDMVIDTADTFYNNTSNNSLRFRNVFSHEHGHGMGLAHTCPVDQTKLMEPFASTRFDGPQHDDILSANRGEQQRRHRLESRNAHGRIPLPDQPEPGDLVGC
jgi:serralysin